ncbi:MAG: ZPR1 zinc finger domain-containing protein [Desulfurococcales archaeon]|nr:ZPR1 zinc finger domain-containing protein [Desulfurococcales archaeon]
MDDENKIEEVELREPILLYSDVIVCPVCGEKSLEVSSYLYSVDYFDRILMTRGICTNCGYKFRDVKLAEPTRPKKIIVHVQGEKQLRYLLVKSAYSYLAILEKGYEMIPGPASTGFITTVEGVLHRFQEALSIACSDTDNEQCRQEKKWLKRAIDGLEKFTLVICDYEGASKVVGDDVEEEPLDDYCIGKKPEWLELP